MNLVDLVLDEAKLDFDGPLRRAHNVVVKMLTQRDTLVDIGVPTLLFKEEYIKPDPVLPGYHEFETVMPPYPITVLTTKVDFFQQQGSIIYVAVEDLEETEAIEQFGLLAPPIGAKYLMMVFPIFQCADSWNQFYGLSKQPNPLIHTVTGATVIYLDENGRAFEEDRMEEPVIIFTHEGTEVPPEKEDAYVDQIFAICRVYTTLACYTFNMMSCANVEYEEKTPTRADHRRAKRQKRETPLTNWHELVIKQDRKHYRYDDVEQMTQSKGVNRRHKVRTHIRTYTTERPLFGHFSGRLLILSHERGNEDLGWSEKDYKLA